jgi:Domain of unknown function (DUF1905)
MREQDRSRSYSHCMNLEFSGQLWFWKGPAPWHFITAPEEESGALEEVSTFVSYGWGMIPVDATIGRTEWTTSLFAKDGRYIVPVKAWVREAEGLDVGDLVTVCLAVNT